MKQNLTLLLFVLMAGLLGCGGETAAPTTPSTADTAPVVDGATTEAVPVIEEAAVVEEDSACPDYARFCMTVEVSGAISAASTSTFGGSFGTCAEWAAAGEARILEMPTVLPMNGGVITVALTRLGAYTGPGEYTVVNVVNTGNPDTYPALDVDGRTFSNGEGTTAVITVADDGSGTVTATGLVELASPRVSSPDPNARLDMTMTWTCQEANY